MCEGHLVKSRITVIALNFLVTFLMIGIYHHFVTSKVKSIAQVNVTSIIREEMEKISKFADPEKSKIGITQFGKRLESAIQQLAREKNLILVPTEAAIAGAPDMTQLLAQKIKETARE